MGCCVASRLLHARKYRCERRGEGERRVQLKSRELIEEMNLRRLVRHKRSEKCEFFFEGRVRVGSTGVVESAVC